MMRDSMLEVIPSCALAGVVGGKNASPISGDAKVTLGATHESEKKIGVSVNTTTTTTIAPPASCGPSLTPFVRTEHTGGTSSLWGWIAGGNRAAHDVAEAGCR
jgi:hypothetical protein